MLAIIIHFCQICIFQEVEKGLERQEIMLELNAKKYFHMVYSYFFCVIETTYIILI